MFFGVSTLIFSGGVDISKDEINCIKNSGFDFIEISSFHYVSPEILAYIANLRMKISSVHSNFLQTDISSLNDVLRYASLQIFKSNIITAKSIGAEMIVVHPGGWNIDKSSIEAKINHSVNCLAEIADFASLYDVRVAIENMPPEFMCDSIEDMHRVLNGVRRIVRNRDSIGICLDTGHANLNSTLPEYISAFGRDIITMHIHDNNGYRGGDRSKAEDDMHNVPGTGKIDWKNVFKKIDESGYDNMLMLELTDSHSSEKNVSKVLIKAKEFLDKL